MELDKLILENKSNSSQIYLRRQELESQKNMIASQIYQVEAEMLRLDGELRLLDKLKTDEELKMKEERDRFNKDNKDGE